MTDAPVCNNAPPSTPDQPDPKTLPSIPPATDLQSAINAVNAIRRILQTIILPRFPLPPPSRGGFSGFRVNEGRGFQEVRSRRVTKVVRVYNPQDKSQYVDVQQVVGIVMQDPITGQVWSWQQ